MAAAAAAAVAAAGIASVSVDQNCASDTTTVIVGCVGLHRWATVDGPRLCVPAAL